MKQVLLVRFLNTDLVTLGRLYCGGELVCYTLELPWRGNKPNVSCIPAGIYQAKYMTRSTSGKHKKCWHILNVHARTEVMIHGANWLRELRGCIAPGMSIRPDYLSVSRSQVAMAEIRRVVGLETFELVIVNR